MVGAPPPVDLAAERRLVDLLVTLAEQGLVRSAHDVSDGGLGLALVEAAVGGPYARQTFGAVVDLRPVATPPLSDVGALFGEDAGRALVSAAPAHAGRVTALARDAGVPVSQIGRVGSAGGGVEIALHGGAVRVEGPRLRSVYFGAIPSRMALTAAAEE
jgi:phosphoribosylformylglycinamidine synthase